MSNVGTVDIEQVLSALAKCPKRAATGEPLPELTGSKDYTGRHRLDGPSVIVRVAMRVADEWTKERAWVTRAVDAVMHNSETMAAGLTSNALRRDLSRITQAWRALDQAAYGTLPKTWRHRIEAAARQRQVNQQQQRDTEAWWALRSADYPVLIPTQPLPVIQEKTPS